MQKDTSVQEKIEMSTVNTTGSIIEKMKIQYAEK